jgi:hypothetical protein
MLKTLTFFAAPGGSTCHKKTMGIGYRPRCGAGRQQHPEGHLVFPLRFPA